MNTKKGKSLDRLGSLEGLRGFAAIAVVFAHITYGFYPHAIEKAGQVHMKYEPFVQGTPLYGFISGSLAVMLFFVLSGFVLTVGYFKTRDKKVLQSLAIKRYLRLMLPALAAVLICWSLMHLGLGMTQQTAAATGSGWIVGEWDFTPNLLDAIYQATIGIFAIGGSQYDAVLWTMKYEFVGSFMVFVAALLLSDNKNRWLPYAALLIGTSQTYFLGFIIGLILADLYVSGKLDVIRQRQAYGLIVAGFIIGGMPFANINSMYSVFSMPGFTFDQNSIFFRTIGAGMIILGILAAPKVQRVLGHPKISILGKYTYSLYLVHYPVIFTLMAGSFLFFIQHMGYNRAVALSLLVTAPVLIAVTYLFEKYVDMPSIQLSKRFAAQYFEGNMLSLVPRPKQVKAYALKKLGLKNAPVIEPRAINAEEA